MVKSGDILVEVSTDKTNINIEANKNGKLTHIAVKEKEKVKVNNTICIITKEKKENIYRKEKEENKGKYFNLSIEIQMNKMIKIKKSINKNNNEKNKISFNDIIIKSVATAIKNNIKVNSTYINKKIKHNKNIHIGIVVNTKKGPIIPVLKFVNNKSISTISKETKNLILKTKIKKLNEKNYQNSTFTISNLGMFNIDIFSAIINSPESCILAIGSIKKTLIIKNKKIETGYLMKVNLSCDNRIIDGATGAKFLKNLKKIIENPLKIIF